MTTEDDHKQALQALCEQADVLGMESLTEIEQCIVNGWPYDKKEKKGGQAKKEKGNQKAGR